MAIPKPWPTITYKGMIKNNSSNKKVGIIRIASKEFLVKENDMIQEIRFLKLDKDKIKMSFRGTTKTITK